MLMSTTSVIEGQPVSRYLGVVTGPNQVAILFTNNPQAEGVESKPVDVLSSDTPAAAGSGTPLDLGQHLGRVVMLTGTYDAQAGLTKAELVEVASPLVSLTVKAQLLADLRRTESAQRFLAESSKQFAQSLDYEASLKSITRLAVPTIADWDQDGLADILFGTTDGRLFVYNTKMRYEPKWVQWQTQEGNFRHTGHWVRKQ